MNRHAQALGRLSGSRLTREQRIERARKAGKAAAAKLTSEQLRDRARAACNARWEAARATRAAANRKPTPSAS